MERNGMHQGGATQGQGQPVRLLQHGLRLRPLRPLLLQVMSYCLIEIPTDNVLLRYGYCQTARRQGEGIRRITAQECWRQRNLH